ncbi:MAG: TetR/AcrR family transcriptional regulator, partial [Longimicrobiales bacterium]
AGHCKCSECAAGEKPFADISVTEIAGAAGVSVGGFYGRFASKDALLALVELNVLEESEQSAEQQLDPARFLGKGIDAIARAYAQLMVTTFRARRVEIIQIMQYTVLTRSLSVYPVAVSDEQPAEEIAHVLFSYLTVSASQM